MVHTTFLELRRAGRVGVVVLAAVGSGLAGCGKKEETPAALRMPEAGRPATYGVLQLMPEDAVAAVAIPSIQTVYDKVEAFLVRAAPESVDMKAEIRDAVLAVAQNLEEPEAESPAAIARAKGVDPEAPIAVFFRIEQPAGQPGPSTEGSEDATRGRAVEPETAPKPAVDLENVAVAVVLECADPREAERTLLELVEYEPFDTQRIEGLDVALRTSADGRLSYFFTGRRLVAGNSADLVRGVAARILEPASIRYGSKAWPADVPDEIVELIRLDRLIALLETAGVESGRAGVSVPWAESMLTHGLPEMARAYEGDDPMVITGQIRDNAVEVRARLDYRTHPQALQWSGAPAPLRHPTLLPDSTLALLTTTLTKPAKDQIQAGLTSGILPVPEIAQTAGRIFDMLTGEITLAVTGVEAGFPHGVLLIEFKDGDEARAYLREMGMLPFLAETYNGVAIYGLPIPLPIPRTIRYALPGNTLVAATDMGQLKTLIDLVGSGKQTALLASLEPPLDPSTPRRGIFVAKRELISEAVLPVLANEGLLSPADAHAFATGLGTLRELRTTAEIADQREDSRMLLQLE